MKYFRLTLPFPPTVNDYLNFKTSYAKGYDKKPIVVSYKTEATKKFISEAESIIKREIIKQQWKTPSRDTWVRVEAIWYCPRSSIDSNNLYKVPLDVLQSTGVVLNDNKIIETCVNYFIDSKNPRIELNIYELKKKGIFLSDEHLDSFKKDNCNECSKPTTCRVLKDFLDNKITENIVLADNICLKKKTK